MDRLGLNPAGVWLFRLRAERRPELPPKLPLQLHPQLHPLHGFCPAAVQVFRMGKALFFIASKGDVKEFFGMGVSEPDQSLFFMGSKGDVKEFLACVLRGVCSHPAGVRVFRNRTCWCSGVSEPDQSIVFYGFQR